MNQKDNLLMNLFICFLSIKQFECNNYIIRSLNHEMYLQRVQKSTLFQFDESNMKSIFNPICYLINMVVKVKEKCEKTRHD